MPTVRIDDTLDMAYEDYDFADPWRPHDTVVLVHGFCKSRKLWYRWIPILAQQYRVVALDIRGMGDSTVPPPSFQWTFSALAKDIRVLLDRLDLDRVHLIGETVGGSVTAQFGAEYPQRLKSLTICTSPFKFGNRQPGTEDPVQFLRDNGVEAWVRSTMHRRVDPNEGDPGHAEWYTQVMSRTSLQTMLLAIGYLGTDAADLTPVLPQIKVPTLLLVGELSAGREWGEGMHALIPGSKLVVIPGATGWVQHTAPEACVEAWQKFVEELAGVAGRRA